MEDFFYKIFEDLPRQGPGDAHSTLRALNAMSELPNRPRILDVGCGHGLQTLALAEATRGHITALDNHRPFLDRLRSNARRHGLMNQITCLHGDMTAMDFPPQTFDLIWSEGAIYIIGFEAGLKSWRKFLAPRGYVALTEITWLRSDPPAAVREFFENEYPAMQDLATNLEIIKTSGYRWVQHFTLPEIAWWDDYYRPLEEKVQSLRQSCGEESDVQALLDQLQLEIDLYRRHPDCYGYVFYVMQLEAVA